jgi:hypothetical protein
MPSVATALRGASAAVGKPSVLRFVKTQGLRLAFVLAAIAGGQWLVLHDSAAPIVSSDGLLYISNANQITSLHGLVDPKVPPGYPILLSAIFLVTGHDNVQAVVIAQCLFFIAAILETYFLLTTLMLPRALATFVACLLAAAPWLVQWERYILTETFSFWLLVTLLLAYVRLIRKPGARAALVCGLVGAAIPLTRPALALVPATLFVVLSLRLILAPRIGIPRTVAAISAIVFALVSYIPVGGYVAANAAFNGCYCYTSISNLNLFGKIYEYGMKDFPADPQYAAISEQVRSFPNINRFLEGHPEYEAQNYAPLGAFARSQFLRYPRQTLHLTIDEIRMVLTLDIRRAVLLEHPFACKNDPNLPYPLLTGDAIHESDYPYCPLTTVSVGETGEHVNRIIYFVIFLAYVALPLSLALGAALVFVNPKRERGWLLLAMSALAASVIVSSSLAGYTAFDRLKVPVDGFALAAAAVAMTELWFVMWQLRGALHHAEPARPAQSA